MKKWTMSTLTAAMLFAVCTGSGAPAQSNKNHIQSTDTQIIDGEEFFVTTYAPVHNVKRTIWESDTSVVIGEYSDLHYTIIETQKDESGNLIPESQVVYSGTYTDIAAKNT